MNTGQVDKAVLEAAAPGEPEELELASGFPAADRDEWLKLVDQVLVKSGRISADAPLGTAFEKLTRTTLDGIAVRPLYTAEDVAELPPAGAPGVRPFVRGTGGPRAWDVRQRHVGTDPEKVREAVLADLECGVSSIWLAVRHGGVEPAALPAALDGVLLDAAPVVLDPGDSPAPDAIAAAEAFLDLAARRDVASADLLGHLGLDPIGRAARTGEPADLRAAVDLAARVAAEYPKLIALAVDGLPVHTAGGSDAQELGYVLSAGVAYLRALTEAGVGIDRAAQVLELRLAATVEQFPTIAKLRAARRLWARVLEASGAAETTISPLHAVSSPIALTRRDPYVNLLRGTIAAFAAGVGGADAVTVYPFDAAIGQSTPFSRRIARNTQTLLVEESHVARVVDPAGGSWYVESLTDALADAAWAVFQELEAAGGVADALAKGLVAEKVAEVREQRERAVATRKAPITGVSEFPDLFEKPVEREPNPVLPERTALPVYRPAAPYEAYRDRSDAVLAETGARPKAFLATLGPIAAHTARATFARNLLQAGGIEPVDAGATETADEVVAAFREAGTPVAVLCGTDELYAERGAETAAALRAAGATTILLAGKAAVDGVDETFAVGGDALATIATVWSALEASR
ncbi:methylmalonyl-CoA mutase family protein [Pseudonocardia thermophila]|jgi:Methylmalonyl-CoA mutase, N-terminal domain/subunit|uniref:methylmalonyl-CoA mutase family protein n=1 Tax=Pseudonocardia thermophila TaxID=1848 RepID=UPI00248DEE22|nr:methylmalonyl-CoA mutase family protein [Pseudonocardia thermophila]